MLIAFRKQAVKALRSMQPKRAAMIREALDKLAEDPDRQDLDVRPLTGRPGYRLRSGDWRVIYRVTTDEIDVMRIAPRGSAY